MKSLKLFLIGLLIAGIQTVNAKAAGSDAINNVLKSYLDVKNALAADNSKAANAAATGFVKAVKSVELDKLTPEQQAAWKNYAEKLRFNGEHIGESTDIKHQREHFNALSTDITSVLKVFTVHSMTLYHQYCPMEKKYWISESKTITNPYLGKQMLDCGVTKETFNGSK